MKSAENNPNLTFDCADVAQVLSTYSVGFGKLSCHEREEDVGAAGSGTLVCFWGASGILTAAHVLEALPDQGPVALMRFRGGVRQKMIIAMDLTEKLVVAPSSGTAAGPDLGFLRLPEPIVANLKATSSFFDLARRFDDVGRPYGKIDCVLGVVGEWTEDFVNNGQRLKKFQLIFMAAQSAERSNADGLDTYAFIPEPDSKYPPPTSYGGVSGGGLWEVLFKPDGSNHVLQRRLIGTAFFERSIADGKLEIIAHGPKSIQKLAELIKSRWAEATTKTN